MPNCLAKKCAISLQSFANGCIACNGEFPFPPPGPVDLPTLCAVPEIAQKRQKNAEGLGRRSAFFLGARLIGAVGDREVKPGHKWGGLVLKAAENMPEDGWRYKKRREIPPFLLFFAVL